MSSLRTRVLKSGGLISAGTLSTRVLGFVREIIAAALFGTGALFDAFVVAFSVPNLFRRVLGEEMFERAFLPPFKRLVSAGQEGRARAFLWRVFLIACAALVVVSLVVLAVLPWLVRLLAPGLDEATTAQALELAYLILPFLFLIGLSSLAGALLQFSGRTLLFSMAPAVTNAVVIVVLVVLHDRLSIVALVVAWLAGALAAIVVQGPAVVKIVRAMPSAAPDDPAPPVTPALREGGTILVSSMVTKAVEVVDRVIASLIGTGAISSLYFSFRIVHLPFSILSLALSRSIAPELSRFRGERDRDGFARLMTFGFDVNLVLLAPVVVFLMLFAEDVVAVFYGRGSFGAESIDATTLAFFYYALAILPMGLIGLLARVYASLEDNRIPLLAALVGGATNVVLDLVLYRTPLKQGGIALASAIGLSVQAMLMVSLLARFELRPQWARLGRSLVRVLPALAVFVAVLLAVRRVLPAAEGFVARAATLVVAGGLGFAVYGFAALWLWPRRQPQKLRVVLTGGGTGGHVYPALAIHTMLERRGMVADTVYLGVKGRAEELIVPRHGLPLRFIRSAPYAGGSPFAKLRTLLVIARGVVESMVALVRFRPHLVVATGGYVSAPVIVAAFLLRPVLKLKIVVDEQNLVPGILNKVASLLANVVLVSFRETAYFIWSSRCVFTGYPVRQRYLEAPPERTEARQRLGIADDERLILVCGGSMGSRSINRVVADTMDRLAKIPRVHVVHAIGLMSGGEYDATPDTVERLQQTLGDRFDAETLTACDASGRVFYRGFGYLHDLIDYQAAADLVISRSGAGSLAELSALGKAMLLVPKRGLPGDHQELNAIGIADKGAAEVLFERRDPSSGIDLVDADSFVRFVAGLVADRERLARLADGAASLFFRGADDRVVDTVQALLDGADVDVIAEIVEPPFVRFQRQFDSLVAHLDRSREQGLYHRLYDTKIEEYLVSPSYLTVNKGIKLIGALRRTDLYPYLFAKFNSFKGFQKRNCLVALAKAEQFEPRFLTLIERGLDDRYFEVRREAIALYSRFFRNVNALPEAKRLQRTILDRLGRRFESFEVRAEAIRAAVRFLDEDAFFATVRPYLWARNVRLREAVLDSVEFGLSAGLLARSDRLRRFIKAMLITTSQFQPRFRVRQRFVGVVEALENGK